MIYIVRQDKHVSAVDNRILRIYRHAVPFSLKYFDREGPEPV